MRLIGKLLIGAIALLMILALVPALIPDADYSPGAKEWLAIANTPTKVPPGENRFHAQAGFLAAAEDDMIDFGARLVSNANRVLEANDSEFDPAWRTPPLSLSPRLDELDFDVVIEDPLAWLASNRSLLRQLADENALLLKRYHQLANMTEYAVTLTPHYRVPIPNYSSLVKIHRLNSLVIAAMIVDNSDNLPRLREEIDKQRLAFADAATIIEKLISLSMLHFDFTLYSRLLALSGATDQHEPFPALDTEERSFIQAYIHEFASGSTLFDGSNLTDDTSGWLENLMISMYLKPRNLQNHAFKHTWMRLISLESRPLAQRAEKETDTAYSWWDRFADPVGYILYEISRPSFTYHDRIEHLDGLITLVNSAAEIHRRSLRGNDLVAYLSKVNAGAHPGYVGAHLDYDTNTNEIHVVIPGYESVASDRPTDQIPRVPLN